MKRTFKTISTLLLVMTLMLGLSMTAFAADSSVTFEGRSAGFEFEPGSEYTATDLFDNFKDVMPGDKVTETIQIKNGSSDSDYIKVYIRALAHDENGNPLTYDEAYENKDGKDQNNVDGQRDETVATMADFLEQLNMKVYSGSTVIYDSSNEELDLENNVLLATLRKGETSSLKVELEVPIELGNEYANRVGEVDWIFTIEGLDDPEPEKPSDPEKPSEPEKPSDPEPTPTPTPTPAPAPSAPKTGDDSAILPYIILMMICAAGTMVLTGMKKRTK